MQAVVEPKCFRDLRDVAVLGGGDERDADALGAGATGPADAVDVGLAVRGRVEVDHMRDSANVDPARRDVCRDERVDRSGLEAAERLFALTL